MQFIAPRRARDARPPAQVGVALAPLLAPALVPCPCERACRGATPLLASGGTGGAYASSALNREFVTQMMVGFQNSLRRHIVKRAEVIAEAAMIAPTSA